MKKLIYRTLVLAVCLAAGATAAAQTVIGATDESGKVVKRILFDREQVTIIYEDGTTRENVDLATIVQSENTGIDEVGVAVNNGSAVREIYDLQGRRVDNLGSLQQGVFIVREGDKVYKLIKK